MSAADAGELAAPFDRLGFRGTSVPDDADAVLVSTCTVRDHAEHRALSIIGALKPWKEADPARVLIVSGCAAERLGEALRKRFPYVDLVVGAKSMEGGAELVARALAQRFDAPQEDLESFAPEQAFRATESPATAFVTIMRGCNYSCSYCIVPAVRGRELYRSVETVLEDCRARLAAGAREIMLLGQTVNSHPEFGALLRAVDALPGLERLRFMSPHPYYFDEEFADVMARLRTACELVHAPVQSGSDRLLKLMRRSYTRDSFLRRIEMLRRKVDGIVFSTDVIVGFSSETEADFEQTLSLLRELRPVSAYCFKYSPRAGTESAGKPDDVSREEKEERLARLNSLVDALTREAQEAQVGKTVEVLAEAPDFGRTRDGFKVRWTRPAEIGRLVRVKVAGASRRTLLGEIE